MRFPLSTVSAPCAVGVLLLAPVLWAATAEPPPRLADAVPDSFEEVERIVAVGDVHGDVDALAAVLRMAASLTRRAAGSAARPTWCRPETSRTGLPGRATATSC